MNVPPGAMQHARWANPAPAFGGRAAGPLTSLRWQAARLRCRMAWSWGVAPSPRARV